MEPKKVTINYALLCKQLEKQGKTKEKFSAELGRSKSFVCNMAAFMYGSTKRKRKKRVRGK